MEPTHPSRTERHIPNSSPYHPPLNSAELAQPTTFSSFPIQRSSTTNPETPILSPLPTRPYQFPTTEARPSTPSTSIEVDPTPGNQLAEINQYTLLHPSTESAIPQRPKHHSSIRQRKRDRFGKVDPKAAAKETEKERRDRRRSDLKARRHHRERCRSQTSSSTDLLADRLSTLSTNHPEPDIRERDIQSIQRQGREDRNRDYGSAGTARQVRDVGLDTISRGAEGRFVIGGEEGSGSGDVGKGVQEKGRTSGCGMEGKIG